MDELDLAFSEFYAEQLLRTQKVLTRLATHVAEFGFTEDTARNYDDLLAMERKLKWLISRIGYPMARRLEIA